MKHFTIIVLTVLILAAKAVQADSKYFSYGAGTNIWDTASAYWGTTSGGPYNTTWSSNDAAFFEGTAGTVALSGAQAANSIAFSVAGYTISNSTLTLNSPAIVSNDFAAAISSVITGSSGLAKAGSSTLTLIGANTYSGGTTVNNGTLQVGNGAVSGTFGSGTYTVSSNATLRVSVPSANSARPTWANISGAGTLSLNTVNLGTANGDWTGAALPVGFTGTLQIGSGRVYASGSGNQGLGGAQQVIVQPNGQLGVWLGGTVTQNCVIAGTGYGEAGYEAAIRLGNTMMTGSIMLSSNATVGSSGVATFAGVISGTNSANLMFGTGSLNGGVVLGGSSSNTYAGVTTVNSGYAVLSKNAGVVAVPGDITMNSSVTTYLWMTQNGQLGGNGILTINGSGSVNTWFFLNGTAQSLAGIVETDVNRNGVIENSQSGVGPGVNSNPGTLTLTGAGSYSYNGYLRNLDGGALTIIKTGSGTQTFVGDRISYTGATIVNNGRLVYSGIGYNSGTVTINSGAVFEMYVASGTANSATSVMNGNGTLVKTGAGTIMWGVQAGTFALGAGSLIDIQAGSIDAGSSANENWAGNLSSLNVATGASISELTYYPAVFDALTGGGIVSLSTGYGVNTLTIGANNTAAGPYNPAGVATFSGVISGGAAVIKSGTGTQGLSGPNTYTATTTINGGRLVVDGAIGTGLVTVNYGGWLGGTGTIGGPVTVNAWGGIAPGDGIGVTTVSNLTLAAGSVNIFDFDGTPTNDLLVVARSGGFTNNGTLFLLYSNGTANAWVPTLASPYNLVQYSGTIAGTGGFSLANPMPGLSYTFTTNGTYVTVTFGGSSVWNGGGADNYWKTAGNWSGVGVTNNAALVFDGNVRTATTNDFVAGTPFSILFTNTADVFILSGNAITLAGDVVNLSPNTQTINNAATLTTLRTINAAAGDLTINGILSGIAGVIKAGPGTLALTAANTYSGITAISGGKLLLTNGSALQNSTLDYNNYGGALSFGNLTNVVIGALMGNQDLALTNDSAVAVSLSVGNNTATYGGSLSGGGSLIKIGAGIQVLSGGSANTYTGPTVIGGSGRLALSKTAGVVAIPGDIVCTNSGNPYLYMLSDNQFGGNGVLTYVGSGAYTRVELGNTAQSVAGIVDASGFGILQHQEGSAANSAGTGTLTLTGSGNYAFNGYLRNANGAVTVIKVGAGTQTLSGGNINYTGVTIVSNGVLRLYNTTAYNSATTIPVGGTLEFTNSVAGFASRMTDASSLAGAGVVNVSGAGWSVVNGTVSLTGVINIANGSTFGGNTGVSAGWGNGTTATVNMGGVNSGLVLRGEDVQIGPLNGSGHAYNNWNGHASDTLIVGAGGGSGTFAGIIHGNGTGAADGDLERGVLNLTKTGGGTQTLTGTNTYTGVTTINGGMLVVNGSLAAGSAVTATSGGTLGGTGNVAGVVSAVSGGHIAPGNSGIGILTNGGLSMVAGGLLDIEFDLANAQTNDQIIVTGSNGLTISGGAINVYSNGTTGAWSTPGTYNLIQYSGTVGGGGAAALSVNNPAPNRSYTFSLSGGWVVMTVGTTTGITWSGSSTVDSKWQTATNWSGNAIPNAGDILTFDGSTRLANTNDFTAGTTFGGIIFNAGAGAFALVGNSVTVAGTVYNYSTTAQTIALPVAIGAGGMTFSTVAGNMAVSSPISGSDGLVKSGSYTLTLSGNHTPDGGMTIASGVLELGGTCQLGGGAYGSAITNNGILLVNNATNQTLSGVISGVGALTKGGAGTLTLSVANTYGGATTLNTGVLALTGGDNRLPTNTTVNFTGNSTLRVDAGSNTIAVMTVGSGITGYGSGSATLVVNGASDLQIGSGSGAAQTLDLSGLNAFVYDRVANAVSIGSSLASPGTGTGVATLASNTVITAASFGVADRGNNDSWGGGGYGTLWLGRTNTINAANFYVAYSVTRSWETGTLKFLAGLANPVLMIRGSSGGSSRANITVGYTSAGSAYNGSSGLVDLTTGVSGMSTVDAMVGTFVLGHHASNNGGGSAAGTAILGAGILDATTINVGVCNAASGTGVLTLNGTTVIVTTMNIGTRTAGTANGTVTINSNATVIAQTIQSGTAGGTRAINWNDGTVQNYGPGTNLTISSGITITLGTGGTNTLNISAACTGTVNSALSGAGGLIKSGTGVVNLMVANTYTGATTVVAGTLRLMTSNVLNQAGAVVLAGGALDAGSYTNVVGSLTVGAGTSSIILGPASLQFANSSTNVWSGSVNLVGPLGPQTLRFGTSKAGLKSAQLQQMNLGGRRVELDPNGYVVLASGTLIMVQ